MFEIAIAASVTPAHAERATAVPSLRARPSSYPVPPTPVCELGSAGSPRRGPYNPGRSAELLERVRIPAAGANRWSGGQSLERLLNMLIEGQCRVPTGRPWCWDGDHVRCHNSCVVVSISSVKEAEPVEVLDALEIFLGQIHCVGDEAGLETLIDTDLSFSQFRSLLILSQENAPAPIHEVAEKLHLSVAATGRNLDRLVKEGLVERQEDEFDRRIKRISLSASGRSLISGFHQQRRSHVLSFLTDLPAADRQRLVDALGPINSRIAARSVSATIGVRASGETPDHHQPLGHQPTTPQEQLV